MTQGPQLLLGAGFTPWLSWRRGTGSPGPKAETIPSISLKHGHPPLQPSFQLPRRFAFHVCKGQGVNLLLQSLLLPCRLQPRVPGDLPPPLPII